MSENRKIFIEKVVVFISSTINDLVEERKGVIEAIDSINFQPSAIEIMGSRSGRPLEVCLEEVSKSHVYILIVGERYGSIPNGENKSFTELEYIEAKKNRKRIRLVYIKDITKEREQKLLDFLVRVKEERFYCKFNSIEELVEQVKKDITREVTKIVDRYVFERVFAPITAPHIYSPNPQVVNNLPNDEWQLLLIAHEYYRNFQYTKALYIVLEGLRLFPNSINFLQLKNILSIEMNNSGYSVNGKEVTKATEFFERLASKEGFTEKGMAFYNAGNGYASINQHLKAIECYESSIKAGNNSAEVWKNIASSYDMVGATEKALECVNNSLARNPNLVQALVSKAIILGRLDKIDEAIELMTRAKEICPNIEEEYPGILVNISYLYFYKGEYEKALRFVKEYDIFPVREYDTIFLKAKILNRLWRENHEYIPEAYEIVSQYVNESTYEINPYWFLELGLLAHRLDDIENEEKYLKLAIDEGYEDALLFDSYAHILYERDEKEDSLKYFKKAYELDNYFAHCYGRALFKCGYVLESLSLFKEAVEIEEKEPVVWHDYGVCLSNLGMFYEAAYAFEKTIEFDDRYVLAYCNLIGTYLNIGFKEQAVKYANKLNRLDNLSEKDKGIIVERFKDAPPIIIKLLNFEEYFYNDGKLII